MKRNTIIMTALGIALTGMGVQNYTEELPHSIEKKYKTRDLENPLYITFHHTAVENASLESIAKGHLRRGFPEIGYHFAIDDTGAIFQLNEIEEITYHDSGENTRSLGIVFLGNFEERPLSEAAYKSAKMLTEELRACLTIKGIRYHKMTSPTLCPGTHAIKKITPLLY